MKKAIIFVVMLFQCMFSIVAYADLDIHFLDVGDADAAIIVCDDEVMVVDAGEPKHSQLVYSYLRTNLCVDTIKYVVMTHPHDDHIGGIPAVMNACSIGTIYSPVQEYHGDRFETVIQTANKQGLAITVPQYGEEFDVGGARCKVVSPIETSSKVNNISIVLLIEYGDTRILLTGDMEKEAEEILLATWEDIHADVMKVAHHGRDTSSTRMFLRVVNADYYVVSRGTQLAERVNDRLEASGEVYTTQEHGTIICHSDGESISFTFLKTPADEAEVGAIVESGEIYFVGNRNSKKLHCSWCDSVTTMAEKNKVIFQTKQEALDNGYTGCARCKP